MSQARQVTVLGSTGSIGESTLDVVARHPDRFSLYALGPSVQWIPCLSNVCSTGLKWR